MIQECKGCNKPATYLIDNLCRDCDQKVSDGVLVDGISPSRLQALFDTWRADENQQMREEYYGRSTTKRRR